MPAKKENDCPTCKVAERCMFPFNKIIFGHDTGFEEKYQIFLPDFNHEEDYLKLGIYKDFIEVNYCPTCGVNISKHKPYEKKSAE